MTAPVEPREAADGQVLQDAILCAWNPREQLVYREALFLVTHPEVHVSTDADYSWWVPAMRCCPTPTSGGAA